MIDRGTTPTIRYNFNVIDPARIVSAYLTLKQDGVLVMEKDLTEATVGENYIYWVLSQEETLSLTERMQVEYECRYRLDDGSAFKTKKASEQVGPILKDGVI